MRVPVEGDRITTISTKQYMDVIGDCIFCGVADKSDRSKIIYEDDLWIAILDGYPVSVGHTLLIPKRHCPTYFDLNEDESSSLSKALKTVVKTLETRYKPQGFNIGVNCGETAGQTIMHCHIHIIPRYKGDCENPKGGVRGVIPSKMSY